jgi:uncharacterized membrane protein YoaK (UPF0700 family)
MSPVDRDIVAALLAVGSGLQSAVARRLAVPDMTTTVLTMTLTGIAADMRAGKRSATFNRRLLAVATMLAGAIGGAEVVLQLGPAAALAVATALLAVVTVAAVRTARTPGAWRSTTQPCPASQPPSANQPPAKGTRRIQHHHRSERRTAS